MNPIDLLNVVNSFYDQAFNKLLITTFGLMAFIGVIIPIAVGWIQLRTLRAEKTSLLNELRLEISAEKEAIETNIKGQVEEQVEEIRLAYEHRFNDVAEKLERATSKAEARSFHLQGNAKSPPAAAVEDFCYAAPLYISARDEINAQRCIRALIETCLPNTDSEQYKKLKIETKCNKLIKSLKAINENARYSNYMEDLENEMEMASSRAPQ